jgi:hypothetical protein
VSADHIVVKGISTVTGANLSAQHLATIMVGVLDQMEPSAFVLRDGLESFVKCQYANHIAEMEGHALNLICVPAHMGGLEIYVPQLCVHQHVGMLEYVHHLANVHADMDGLEIDVKFLYVHHLV